ncbi:MAG: hypothetical protein H6934_02970 [Burkholderiaceae bacterium]|nr:hypothetical protein [Burkholderiaceae bacterium]
MNIRRVRTLACRSLASARAFAIRARVGFATLALLSFLSACGSGGSEPLIVGLIDSQLKSRDGVDVVRDLFLRETMTVSAAADLGTATDPKQAGADPCPGGGTITDQRDDANLSGGWDAGDTQQSTWIDCERDGSRVSGRSTLRLEPGDTETLVLGFDDLVAVNPLDGSVTRYDGALRFEVSDTESAIVSDSLTVTAVDATGTHRVGFTGLEMRIGEQGDDLYWIVNGSFTRQVNGGPTERMRIVTEEPVRITPGELCPAAGRVRFESETGDVLTVSFVGEPSRLRLALGGASVSIPCAEAS